MRPVRVHALARAHRAGQRLGRGDDLAVGDQHGDVAEDLVDERRVVRWAQVGELLRAEQQAQASGATATEQPHDPGGAIATEQPHDPGGSDRGELVDEHERRDGLALELGGDR